VGLGSYRHAREGVNEFLGEGVAKAARGRRRIQSAARENTHGLLFAATPLWSAAPSSRRFLHACAATIIAPATTDPSR